MSWWLIGSIAFVASLAWVYIAERLKTKANLTSMDEHYKQQEKNDGKKET